MSDNPKLPGRRMPRIIEAFVRKPKGEQTSDSPPAAQPTSTQRAPRVIPGSVARTRIVVSVGELKSLSPGLEIAVYEQACELVGTFVAGKIASRDAIMFGHEHQKTYSDLVSRILRLSNDQVLVKTRDYLNRMLTILGTVDPMALSGQLSKGVFAGFGKSVNKKIDTPEELRSAQKELQSLVEYMETAANKLLTLRSELEELLANIGKLARKIEASALAALYLSNYLEAEGNSIDLVQAFTNRSMSLTQSVAQITQDQTVRKIQTDQPLQLISLIQNVALVSMPGLLSALAALVTTAETREVTPTDAGEVKYLLQEILEKLSQ